MDLIGRSGRVEIDILRPGNYPLPQLLDEENFASQMEEEAEPYLNRFKKTGMFGMRNELYYEIFPQHPNKGTVVICHGLMESSQKYHELIYYLLKAGFQAAVYDQRGHGRSARSGQSPDIVHIDSFDEYTDDLHSFITQIIDDEMVTPADRLFIFGHSFGGAVAAKYLEVYPVSFFRAILNCPMFEIDFGSFPSPALMALETLMITLRQGNRRCIGQRPFDRRPNPARSGGRSESRYFYYHDIRVRNKEYQTSGFDYYWAREITKAGINICRSIQVQKIRSDVLVIMAGQDNIAGRQAQEAFISKLKYGAAVLIPESRHETYTDHNNVLASYLSLVMSWLEGSAQ